MSTLQTTNLKNPSSGSNNIVLDSSGRVLVGTSATSAASTAIFEGYNGVSSNPGVVRITKGVTTPSNGDVLGYLAFGDSTHTTGAQITGDRDGGTWSASSKPTRLSFGTSADGASNPTERFRISSTGAQSSVIPGGSTLYPQFACRAWVNFNGTGTVAIRTSGNVSSITDNGVGLYTANFTTAMPDNDYTMMGTHSYMDSYRGGVVQFTQITSNSNTAFGGATQLTGSCAFRTVVNSAGSTPNDPATVLVTFFR